MMTLLPELGVFGDIGIDLPLRTKARLVVRAPSHRFREPQTVRQTCLVKIRTQANPSLRAQRRQRTDEPAGRDREPRPAPTTPLGRAQQRLARRVRVTSARAPTWNAESEPPAVLRAS